MFEFYTLSWFHLYVAAGPAPPPTVLAFSVLARSRRNVAPLLAVMALLLAPAPLVRQIVLAGSIPGLHGHPTRCDCRDALDFPR